MFQNGQKVVVVSSGDERRVIKVQSASGTPDPSRYPIVDTTGVTGRDQQVQIVSGGDATRFPILRGVSDARATADSVISALTPAAWYRNATGVTSAGGFASQWDDYSGNARHLKQTTGTNQPAYANGVFTFDGSDNFMKALAFTLNQPTTVVIVGKQVTWTNSDYIFDGNAINGLVLQQNTSTPNLNLYAGLFLGLNSNLAVNTRGIICCVFNGASSVLRVNNTADATGNAGATNAGGFTLGSNGVGGGGWSNIAVEEAVLFPSALSDANRTAVITALNNALTVF